MSINFSEITIYELFALILSIIAILIPIIQWAWKKWVIKPVLYHLPTGRAYLFINRSGSYIQIEGVFEAKNKPISVKNVALKVLRVKDDKVLNLRWSTFTSPMSQRMGGNYSSITETTHPIRIDGNSMICAFIEFADFYDSFSKTFQPYYDALAQQTDNINSLNLSYERACQIYTSSEPYKMAKSLLDKELFWEIGQYEITLEAEYGKEKVQFFYKFSVNADDYKRIELNLVETLAKPIKDLYMKPLAMQTVQVELNTK